MRRRFEVEVRSADARGGFIDHRNREARIDGREKNVRRVWCKARCDGG